MPPVERRAAVGRWITPEAGALAAGLNAVEWAAISKEAFILRSPDRASPVALLRKGDGFWTCRIIGWEWQTNPLRGRKWARTEFFWTSEAAMKACIMVLGATKQGLIPTGREA